MERAIDLSRTAEQFGGYSALARRLTEYHGIPVALSTCHGWARRDKIPPWRAKEILTLAQYDNVDVIYKQKKKQKAKQKAKPQAG